jgi:hypothetical protein
MSWKSVFIGKNIWAIPAVESHETLCFLNTTKLDAQVRVTAYFPDRDPAEPYAVQVPGERTLHLRLNELKFPEPVPRGKEFAAVVESNVPIVVQHMRLDSRRSENALLTTIAYAQ